MQQPALAAVSGQDQPGVSWAVGGPLADQESLRSASVLDGDLLHVRPVPRTATDQQVEAVLVVFVALTQTAAVTALGLGAGALALLGAALALQRRQHRGDLVAGCAVVSWPLAAGAVGWALTGPATALERVSATGASGLLVGLLVALLLSAVAVQGLRPVSAGLVWGTTLGAATAGAAALGASVPAAAGVGGLAGIALLGALPRFAVRSSGLAALDDAAAADGRPARAAAVRRSTGSGRQTLALGVLSVALTELACVIGLALHASAWSSALAGLLCALLLLRARALLAWRQVTPLVTVGLLGGVLTGWLALAKHASAVVTADTGLAVLGVGVVALITIAATELRPAPATQLRRALDLAERVLLVAAVPVLAGALGAYSGAADLVR